MNRLDSAVRIRWYPDLVTRTTASRTFASAPTRTRAGSWPPLEDDPGGRSGEVQAMVSNRSANEAWSRPSATVALRAIAVLIPPGERWSP